MGKGTSVLAIILARGGSKGLKNKNILPLNGKPLIQYTIEAALNCKLISQTIVSTDDPEISAIAKELKCDVIQRPPELAADNSLSTDGVRHVLENFPLENEKPEYIILLQPTSPLRNASHLDKALRDGLNKNVDCMISVTQSKPHPYKMFSHVSEEKIEPLFGFRYLHLPRQVLPKTYRQNGAFYLIKTSKFLDCNSFSVEPIYPFLMTQEDSVDIDSELDLKIAEEIIKKRQVHE